MKTNQDIVMPTVGGFAFGLLAGILLFTLTMHGYYTKSVNEAHWASQVIEECIEQYPNFFDTIGEGDNWDNYIISKQ